MTKSSKDGKPIKLERGKSPRGQSVTRATAKPKVEAKAKPKMGRPSDYTPELADRICDLIASSDKGLTHICAENPDMPGDSTIRAWVWRHPEFKAKYMCAREAQQLWMFDKQMQVAADGRNDTYIDSEGQVRVDHDHIARSRLLADTIKWQASKLAPKLAGDKVDVNHGGQVENPLSVLFSQVAGTPLKPKSEE